MKKKKTDIDAIEKVIASELSKDGLPIFVEIPENQGAHRLQKSRYPDPIFYNKDSDSRYGDPKKEIGVCYVALSDNAAAAETLQNGQGGPGSPVLQSEIDELSLHKLVTTRKLRVIDVGLLARYAGGNLESIVQGRGEGSEGYAYTQALSSAVMRHDQTVDGMIYPSRVWPVTGSHEGCNLVLFEGRPPQLAALSSAPLNEVELSCGDTIYEFLARIKVPVE